MAAPAWIHFALLISLCLAVCSATPLHSETANLEEPDPDMVKTTRPFRSISGHRGFGRAYRQNLAQAQGASYGSPPNLFDGCDGNYGGYRYPCGCNANNNVLYRAIKELTIAVKSTSQSTTQGGGGGGGGGDATSFAKQQYANDHGY